MSLSLEPRQTWTEVFPVVKDVFREGGAVAFACSALLLLLYRLLPRVRRTPGWLILRAALCEALVSIVFFLFYYFGKDKDHAEWEMSGDGEVYAQVMEMWPTNSDNSFWLSYLVLLNFQPIS